MPRRPRVFVEGGIYHVYNRFARGADLFSEPEEAIEFMEILRRARDRDDLRVYAERQGTLDRWAWHLSPIIEQFRRLGVEKCGATHCTGDRQIAMFQDTYGENFVPMGTGRVLTFTAAE